MQLVGVEDHWVACHFPHETVVELYNPEHAAVAEAVAIELGGVEVVAVELEEPDVDLRVVIGTDLVGAPT